MTLHEIAKLCGASHTLTSELAGVEPAGFTLDSRTLRPGDFFLAIPGEQVDGHRFVMDVLDRGACAALVTHKRLPFATNLSSYRDRLLFVTDTTAASQQMAARVLAAWGHPVVGVTGSAGKTTIKDITAHVLEPAGRVFKSLGNLNTGYGLPLTVGRMISGGAKPGDYDLAVLEMGMNSYGEIMRLTEIAQPSVAVVGNVGTAHIEFFGSQTAIARAKAEIVDGLTTGGVAVLNADDPLVREMATRRDDIGVILFGIDDPAANIRATDIQPAADLGGTNFLLQTPAGAVAVTLPLIGRHNVYNALAAAAVGHHFGLSAQTIAARLATAAPSKMRGEIHRFAGGVTVIDDSYNSNPQALIEAVRGMAAAPGFTRRIVVAGEMLELGEQGAALHRQAGRDIARAGVDRVIGVRGLARELVAGAAETDTRFANQALFVETPEKAGELLAAESRPGDLILVKGSRGVRTEKTVAKLREVFAGSPDESGIHPKSDVFRSCRLLSENK
ncbi:MAG: UDP-N-acetylmuramoyl-tripeptide--D-alanyl-D-alanine ligase [Blastocatellia bacterium]